MAKKKKTPSFGEKTYTTDAGRTYRINPDGTQEDVTPEKSPRTERKVRKVTKKKVVKKKVTKKTPVKKKVVKKKVTKKTPVKKKVTKKKVVEKTPVMKKVTKKKVAKKTAMGKKRDRIISQRRAKAMLSRVGIAGVVIPATGIAIAKLTEIINRKKGERTAEGERMASGKRKARTTRATRKTPAGRDEADKAVDKMTSPPNKKEMREKFAMRKKKKPIPVKGRGTRPGYREIKGFVSGRGTTTADRSLKEVDADKILGKKGVKSGQEKTPPRPKRPIKRKPRMPRKPMTRPRGNVKTMTNELKAYRQSYKERFKAMAKGRAAYTKWYAANHSRSQELAKSLRKGMSPREWAKVERGLESMRNKRSPKRKM